MIQTIQQPSGDGDDVHLFRILQGLFYHAMVAEKKKVPVINHFTLYITIYIPKFYYYYCYYPYIFHEIFYIVLKKERRECLGSSKVV